MSVILEFIAVMAVLTASSALLLMVWSTYTDEKYRRAHACKSCGMPGTYHRTGLCWECRRDV